MSLEFNPATHQYAWAGQLVPSVTQILKPILDYSRIDPEVLAAAAARGNAVHLATELDDQGTLDPDSVDEALAGYIAAYRAWKREASPVILLSETQVYHGTMRYAGTLDRVVAIGDDEWLIDIKTGDNVIGAVGPQTAAYEAALNFGKPLRRAFLQLKSDGSYRFRELTSPRDWAVFLSCHLIHRFKQENQYV